MLIFCEIDRCIYTAQKMKFSVEDFFIKLHFLCSVSNSIWTDERQIVYDYKFYFILQEDFLKMTTYCKCFLHSFRKFYKKTCSSNQRVILLHFTISNCIFLVCMFLSFSGLKNSLLFLSFWKPTSRYTTDCYFKLSK